MTDVNSADPIFITETPIDETDPLDQAFSAQGELRQMLHEDESRLGDVYRLYTLQGLSAQEVANELNVSTPGFVYSYSATVQAILHGKLPSSVTLQKAARGALRSLLRQNRHALTKAAITLLTERIQQISANLTEESLTAEVLDSTDHISQNSPGLENLDGVAGIYAFSYGWYLEHPVDERFNSTLIKIGRADDIGRRIREHRTGARAHMPEPLVVVRAYSAQERDLASLERDFHRLLSTAGHDNPRRTIAVRRNEVGREWFLTNEQFLDAVASALNLRTEHTGQSDFLTD